jgi:integrase
MPKLDDRVPKYRLHRRSGQAVVTLSGKDHYLGPHGTAASSVEYDRLIAEWLTQRRQPIATSETAADISVNKLILLFWEHAQTYYCRPDGTHTSEVDNFKRILKLLRRGYGTAAASGFGPLAIKALREQMIAMKWGRKSINKQVSRIKMVFRWAVENELVPPSVHQALLAVRGLSRGRTEARETLPVPPVPEERIAAIKPFVSRQVWALTQLQLLTGARAGELTRLRGIDFKPGDSVWTVEPAEHKTAYLGRSKRIYFGPRAIEIVKKFMSDSPLDAYLFSPIAAEAERRSEQHAKRTTPIRYGNRPGTNRKAKPGRTADEYYTVASYRRAIARACDQAFPPPDNLSRIRVDSRHGSRWERASEWKSRVGPEGFVELRARQASHRWHPHQLRHNAATHLRKEFGIETARIILGHSSASVTEIFAELDDVKALSVMQKIG